ncbi:beta-ketoacyl synthase N-terminal-like domain-containing protein, partial [uncultured Aquimarina sp.]|uniref:beta-ketoacyl synthase N-terminal-like domain-containing protein n=1 Tax=uncultured Aquimarina sp. TaxID=575652 RepID=UPI00260BFFE8
ILLSLDSFPLTVNGKLDRHSLPDPDFDILQGEDYVGPTTELEIKLSQIYSEILGLANDRVGTDHNFFRIGGNSILSIQLRNKLVQLDEFKHISMTDLFKYDTINKLIRSLQYDNQTVYKLQNTVIQTNTHEVAVIGVSGAFSGADNIMKLWQLISNQEQGIRFYSKDECRDLKVEEALLSDPNYIPVAGLVKDIELFDPFFWGMSPNEAKQLDPQIRKFLEHCWFVLESSGYIHQRRDYNIGVFAGSGNSNYFYNHVLQGKMRSQINIWDVSVSNSKDALATKAAFFLGLSGPAHSINTACSTGLVSVV